MSQRDSGYERKQRGRKPGQLQNPRDANGWMVPREGTVRRAVYEALCAGLNRAAIREQLQITERAFAAHKANITNWQKVAEWRSAWMREEAYG